jgi:hypothetical protein
MATFYRFTVFEDAFFFCNQAKGLPDVLSTVPLKERYSRASIILSWVALEEALSTSETVLRKRGVINGDVPKKLREKATYLAKITEHQPVDASEFLSLRRLRNELAHPHTGSKEHIPTPEEALTSFKFCLETASRAFPDNIKI